MTIERTKGEVIFRLPGNINLTDLQAISNYLQLSELTGKSRATQKQVDKLVRTVKKGRWAKTKKKIGL